MWLWPCIWYVYVYVWSWCATWGQKNIMTVSSRARGFRAMRKKVSVWCVQCMCTCIAVQMCMKQYVQYAEKKTFVCVWVLLWAWAHIKVTMIDMNQHNSASILARLLPDAWLSVAVIISTWDDNKIKIFLRLHHRGVTNGVNQYLKWITKLQSKIWLRWRLNINCWKQQSRITEKSIWTEQFQQHIASCEVCFGSKVNSPRLQHTIQSAHCTYTHTHMHGQTYTYLNANDMLASLPPYLRRTQYESFSPLIYTHILILTKSQSFVCFCFCSSAKEIKKK